MNGEGKTAVDVSKTQDVQRLLQAAGLAARRDRERRLLTAAKEGRVDEVQELVALSVPPFFLNKIYGKNYVPCENYE